MSVMKRSVACLCAVSLLSLGCYNTYTVPKAEFERLQRAESVDTSVVVKSKGGDGVQVTKDTLLFVRSDGGRRYPITPFNFKVTQSQLVASDRDTLLALDEISNFEVDHISVGWTATFIATGAAAVAGLIVLTVLNAGEGSGFGGQ